MNRLEGVTKPLMWFMALGVAAVILLPLSAFAAPIDTLHPGEWYEFPNSNMSAVDPCPKRNCVYSGTGGQDTVMDAWGGGVYDTKRDQLIVWGGGHSDYAGNEVYAFGPLTSSTPAWRRLSEPSTTIASTVAYYPDGPPSARHTYGTLAYDELNDRFMSFSSEAVWGNAHAFWTVDSFDLGTNTWAPAGTWPKSHAVGFTSGSSTYDPARKGFWSKNVASTPLAFFDPNANSGGGLWTSYGPSFDVNYHTTMALDTKRNQLVCIGSNNNHPIFKYDLNNPSIAPTFPASTGDAGGLAVQASSSPGFVYDPVGDRFLAWNGGTNVYALDPVTFVWSKLLNYAGSTVNPGAKNANGTFGRFRYVPSKGGMIVVNKTNGHVFFYKLTNAISSTPSPTVASTVTPAVTPAVTLPRKAPYRLNPTVTPTISIAATPTSVTSDSSATLTRSSANHITTIPTGAITTVQLVSTAESAQTNAVITFGHVFKQGDVPAGFTVTAKDSLGNPVLLQVDKKATHADGSLRHAIISAVIPGLAAGQTETIALTKATSASAPSTVSPTTLTAAGFTASVNITLGGVVYTASADSLLNVLNTSTCTACKWLSGPTVNEWMVSAPLKTAAGVAHPHLSARFAIRSYTGQSKARVDVTIENDWAYVTRPQNFTYDANIIVGGTTVYSVSAVKHYHHARWRKVFWWGAAPQVDVKFNTAYLIATKAVSNYDQSITPNSTGLTALNTQWTNAGTSYNILTQYGTSPQTYDTNIRTGPMGQGILIPYMGTTGGRPELGPLPQWDAMYILSMDSRAKNVSLGTGDLAGSWPLHYRDKDTDLPISIITYPYAITWTSQHPSSIGPGPGGVVKNWAFPAILSGSGQGDTSGPFTPDTAHEPSLAYLPYLVTGDYYYLEEMQFWATWNMVQTNHGNRTFGALQGLDFTDQLRGQAWVMRTLGQVAYITPDTHPMKTYWMDRVSDNLSYYNTKFVVENPNSLGIAQVTSSYFFNSILYPTERGANTGYPPWQDDFFTWSMGYFAELGFNNAAPILAWKAKFPVGRMTAPGYCWIDGAAYALAVRPSATSALYSTLGECWLGTFGSLKDTNNLYYKDQACGSVAQASWRHLAVGEMTGYAHSPEGFPSNMQPALAVAAASGIANAQAAWTIFINRAVKPDYTTEPQFAIVPRN